MENIVIADIDGQYNINSSTAIIILYNVPIEYLTLIYETIYTPDKELYKYIKHKLSSYNLFMPIGQIKENPTEQYNIVYANTSIYPLSTDYKEIKKNIWVGTTTIKKILYKTIGTIMSKTKPIKQYPVFPSYMLTKRNFKVNNIYKDIYSDSSYGRWKLDNTKHTIIKQPSIMQYYKINSKLKMTENKNPWYYNNDIMGGGANIKEAYKITGKTNKKYDNSTNIIIYIMFALLLVIISTRQLKLT